MLHTCSNTYICGCFHTLNIYIYIWMELIAPVIGIINQKKMLCLLTSLQFLVRCDFRNWIIIQYINDMMWLFFIAIQQIYFGCDTEKRTLRWKKGFGHMCVCIACTRPFTMNKIILLEQMGQSKIEKSTFLDRVDI